MALSNCKEYLFLISEKEWKNKVQVELKGLEYNETLVWGTNDQINVKPLYTKDDVDYSAVQPLPKSSKDWKIISKYTGNKNQDYSFLYGYLINQNQIEKIKIDFPKFTRTNFGNVSIVFKEEFEISFIKAITEVKVTYSKESLTIEDYLLINS